MKIALNGKYGAGLFAEVDDGDSWLCQFNWYVVMDEHRAYAATSKKGHATGMLLMHVAVLGKQDGAVIDHVDGNGLNNTRMNLRHVTPAENAANAKLSKRNKTGVKGVYVETINGLTMLRACVASNYVRHRKYFKLDELELAKHWVRAKRLEVHGAFANHGECSFSLVDKASCAPTIVA